MSIRITIEGTQEGLSRLQSLFESGEFDELDDLKILGVREVTSTEECAFATFDNKAFKFLHNRLVEGIRNSGIAMIPPINEDYIANHLLALEELLNLGLNTWNPTTTIAAKLLGMGFHGGEFAGQPEDSTMGAYLKETLKVEKVGWYLHLDTSDDLHCLFIRYKRLLFCYPTEKMLIDYKIIKNLKHGSCDPNPINAQTWLRFHQVEAIINSIECEET